jgi:hypothetical protein
MLGCISTARALLGERPWAARCASEPRGFASCLMRHAEVTKTASVRGGAVCLPNAIIPDSCPAIGIDPCLASLFSKVLLPLPAPCTKGSGLLRCTASGRNRCNGSIAPNLRQLRGRAATNTRVASRSTALDRRPIGGKLPVPLRYAERLNYFYHFTGHSQSGRKILETVSGSGHYGLDDE